MKLAVIYNKNDYKLSPQSYSKNYIDMFTSLIERFEEVSHINAKCDYKDIDADVIVFWDVHSCHHIKIKGIERHSAVKYEYMNDPHQNAIFGKYEEGGLVCKLGPKQRAKRALQRGIDYIICPSITQYNNFIGPHLDGRADDMLIYFPVTPKKPNFALLPYHERMKKIIASGSCWRARHGGFDPYEFRAWAYMSNSVKYMSHYIQNRNVPTREKYLKLLSLFVGGLAMCDAYIVARYMELPLCGCLTIMQELEECYTIGFKDGENCIFVDRENFEERIRAIKNNPADYQQIANAGRELIENNWTAEHFADHIYNHAQGVINGNGQA